MELMLSTTLQEMYESEEQYNDGLLSFRYPLHEATDEELDYFLGGLISSATHAVETVTKPLAAVVKPIVKPVVKPLEGVAKTVGKAVSAVNKVVPVSMLTSTLARTPLGMAVSAGLGAAQAAAEGKNVFQGAVRNLAPDVASRFLVDTGMAAARGEDPMKAAERAFQAGIGDVRKSLQFAAMVAPFVPGIGTGVAAALGAANALAAGQPITDAMIAAARDAVPGGAVAQFAFDTAVNMAKGKNIAESLLDSARSRIPGGPAVQAAFDAGLALAKGKNIQTALMSGAGRLLPPSPYAADALSFVKKVASGQNIQQAALSSAGNLVLKKMNSVPLPLHRELEEEVFTVNPASSGRWLRRNGHIFVLSP